MSGKTKEELQCMTTKQLREYAKEIGCCLGYDGSRKDTAINAILVHQEHNSQGAQGCDHMELKHCPYCGGEASVNIMPFIGFKGSGYVAQCESCWAKTAYYCTKAEAIAAWNTRHEGTCDDVAIEGEWFECSECGCVRRLIHPSYCPNCGRKVER